MVDILHGVLLGRFLQHVYDRAPSYCSLLLHPVLQDPKGCFVGSGVGNILFYEDCTGFGVMIRIGV